MAISKLNGITEIDGFGVSVMDELRNMYPDKFNESGAMDYEWFENEIRQNRIYVNDKDSIAFTLQDDNNKDVTDCRVDTIIAAAIHILERMNEECHSDYYDNAIHALSNALRSLASKRKYETILTDNMIHGC